MFGFTGIGLSVPQLVVPQVCVLPSTGQEITVGTGFKHTTIPNDENSVGIHYG